MQDMWVWHVGLIPGQGAKIPHASWPKLKTEGYNNKFNEVFFFLMVHNKRTKRKDADLTGL